MRASRACTSAGQGPAKSKQRVPYCKLCGKGFPDIEHFTSYGHKSNIAKMKRQQDDIGLEEYWGRERSKERSHMRNKVTEGRNAPK